MYTRASVIAARMNKAACLLARTSGSSGMPATVFYSTRAVIDTMLHAERSRAIAAAVYRDRRRNDCLVAA